MASASIEEAPVRAHAANLVTAMKIFAVRAATTALVAPSALTGAILPDGDGLVAIRRRHPLPRSVVLKEGWHGELVRQHLERPNLPAESLFRVRADMPLDDGSLARGRTVSGEGCVGIPVGIPVRQPRRRVTGGAAHRSRLRPSPTAR